MDGIEGRTTLHGTVANDDEKRYANIATESLLSAPSTSATAFDAAVAAVTDCNVGQSRSDWAAGRADRLTDCKKIRKCPLSVQKRGSTAAAKTMA